MEQPKQQPQVPKQDASRGVKDTGEVKHHDAQRYRTYDNRTTHAVRAGTVLRGFVFTQILQ
jgi:hypothetical protein